MADESWREQRSEAAAAHAAALERRRRAESDAAAAQLATFVERATTQGPAPVPLRARTPDGRRTFRTPLHGWYLRRDHTVAVDTDGRYFVLVTPERWAGLFRGVNPNPTDPPLVIGAGGKDGESLDLPLAIQRVLDGETPQG